MVQMKELEYGRFGKCLCLTNGEVELYVTLSFGPRIIRAGFTGGENFMFEDTDGHRKQHFADGPYAGKTFDIAGGHRLWIAPEATPRTYYPDNQPVGYDKTANGVRLTIAPQTESGLQLSVEIAMSETGGNVTLRHTVTNIGMWGAKFAPWCLSMLAAGGVEVFPVNDMDTGLLSNRFLELWPYAKMTDPRIHWGDRYLQLRQDPNATEAFKLGCAQDYPWAAYFLHGDLFIKQYDVDVSAEHADHGCTFETYTCADFLEMETLGAYKVVQPGETVEHTERWSFYQNVAHPGTDEGEIEKLMKKYL